ncbi:hypothetical protein TOPH_03970 [Tolypocladium ophioglossoides CBS 100239]|uniref:Uncharacterized protein n=1 Tax=Tolypocladium ophioglossoides (strain CBS 100239) TaxID=1163406 RepID=A0A0L0NC65_TOLOC|nr:hypothetical protein TOPH_03970 [Tolypocladium ophioglossoides CBS 100239]
MAHHNAARPQGHVEARHGLAATPENRFGTSYETGESSTTGSLLDATLPIDDSLGLPLNSSPSGVQPGSAIPAPTRQGGSTRRKLRHRSGAGFLLQDKVSEDRDPGHRRSVRDASRPKARASPAPQTPEPSRSNAARDSKLELPSDIASSRQNTASPRISRSRSSGGPKYDIPDAQRPRQSSPQHDARGLDVDSAQIVNMALNLSESRRIASRRNVSRGTPPRLAPVPDGSSGSNLRQHLQQQRRSSRNMSPKPKQAPSPRLSSGARLNSPLQPTFDSGHDEQYRYRFSTSTLSRAQKAREHLELMAQYRRLLDTLPPLKPGFEQRRTASPPSSPMGNSRTIKTGSQNNAAPAVGRQYNPLQYIRNRKVRARERKVIDGERQGFGDVEDIDKICSRSSSLNVYSDEVEPAVPAFQGADEPEGPTSPDAASRAAARVRRPRVDWFIEPCDMVADAYWLEQEQHKHLIEDRQWRKIFPPAASIPRPMSHETDDPSNAIPPFSLQTENPPDAKSSGITKLDSDLSHGSTRDRAKQKLQNIRAFPHRHNGSLHGHHHDFMRLKKDSASDLSSSDNDGKKDTNRAIRPGRSGTISSNANDLLEKQMREIVAKEARERVLAEEALDNEATCSPPVMTPERNPLSQPSSRFHSRKGSMADTSDSDRNAVPDRSWLGSPPRYKLGQQGIDVADQPPRESIEKFSSMSTSPELQAARDGSELSAIGTQLSSPWSRAASPTRNPLSKIKHIMRDKSGDSGNGPHLTAPEQEVERRTTAQDSILPVDETPPPNRRQSSPTRKSVPGRQLEPWTMHRRSGSLRLRPEDQGVGLRGIFKGPRLDTVIRGGVSRLGDMLWRKDGSTESTPELESTDESESERARGRQRPSLSLSRRPSKRTQDDARHPSKHFLDSMPEFQHTSSIHHTRSAGDDYREATPSESAIHSRQSSRFDLLKPPRIDARNSSSSASPPGSRKARLGDSDASESESWQDSVLEGVRDADKPPNSALRPPGSNEISSDEIGRRQSRHWSIADKGCGTQQARLSRREIARMRALILSSGIKAMEINRRAGELHKPFVIESLAMKGMPFGTSCAGVGWADIAKLCSDRTQLCAQQVTHCELYPLAASTLGGAIQASGQRWQGSADCFANKTSPELQRRIGAVRSLLVDGLSEMTRSTADEADEMSRDLALGQPVKVKHVVDIIEKMLRRRRRRLRWVRRALWLTVEWLLVGFMWYVWFVVMILRVFLGVGKGVWRGVRWLLWM